MSSHQKKNIILFIVTASLLTLVGVGALVMTDQESSPTVSLASETPDAVTPSPAEMPVVSSTNEPKQLSQTTFVTPTPAPQKKVSPETLASLPFTEEDIFRFLEQIHLDEQGNLLTDYVTLQALQDFLGHDGDLRLGKEHLELFRELIMVAMPGSTGAQIAELASNYHEYSNAFSEKLKDLDQEAVQGMERENLEDIMALRRLYLGDETARQLFGKIETDSDYMMESMKTQMDPNISKEKKQQRQQEITQRYIDETITTLDLTIPYQRFYEDKKRILQESSDPAEIEQRLQASLKEHFTPLQLEQIRHLPLETQ